MKSKVLNRMSLTLALSLNLLLGTLSFAADSPPTDVFFAKCSLYKGDYSPTKTPTYELDVVRGEFVDSQINISLK